MTDLLERHIAWCKEKRAVLRQQLEALEAGQIRTLENRRTAGEEIEQVDTTADTIQQVRSDIAALNEFLVESDASEAAE